MKSEPNLSVLKEGYDAMDLLSLSATRQASVISSALHSLVPSRTVRHTRGSEHDNGTRPSVALDQN